MDDTLTFALVFFVIVGIVVALLKRAERRREEKKRAMEYELRQQEQAHAHWLHQQQMARQQARHAELAARFGAENASRIMRGEIWQGQTAEMLVEALGQPVDIDEKVLKTKSRHVYKYRPMGTNRYRLRVTLENGVVVGWEDKS